jgi:hypothetical protein
MDALAGIRDEARGFHPFLVAITDSALEGREFTNLFGSHRGGSGLAAITTANVEGVIIPDGRMSAYFVYYFARYVLSFLAPERANHEDSRECVFDRKASKIDILSSMKRGALCDECRTYLASNQVAVSAAQFAALDDLFELSGELLLMNPQVVKPRVFVGSSSEGLPIAYKLQELLGDDYLVEVWNQGIFGLGSTTIEALEDAVTTFDFGVFIFTPDDEVVSRDVAKPSARDNVIFEAGMFVGKLGRKRALIVEPGSRAIVLPSDLASLTTARYDGSAANLSDALGPTANRIRAAIGRATP